MGFVFGDKSVDFVCLFAAGEQEARLKRWWITREGASSELPSQQFRECIAAHRPFDVRGRRHLPRPAGDDAALCAGALRRRHQIMPGAETVERIAGAAPVPLAPRLAQRRQKRSASQ